MPIFVVGDGTIQQLTETTFAQESMLERRDLQRLLRSHISAIARDTLVVAEEFDQWQESGRRIDLLAIDRDANVVVIELKRDEEGGHMELQALRYAAMISTLTYAKVVDIYAKFLRAHEIEVDAEKQLLDFLDWDEPRETEFNQKVRIVLASADFSKEITSTVMWLNGYGLDIRCVRIKPYRLDTHVLLDVQQIIPLPEATEYQVRIQEKVQVERAAKATSKDYTRFDVTIDGVTYVRQAKNHTMMRVLRHLCAIGVRPEEIQRVLGEIHGNLWMSVDGDVDAETFRAMMAAQRASEGRVYEPSRHFTADDTLVHANGRTYAIAAGWGTNVFAALDRVNEAFGGRPGFALAVVRSE